MNTVNKQFDDVVKATQEQATKFQETVVNSFKQAQPALEKMQETINSNLSQLEPQIKKAQENWNEAVAKINPELAKTQAQMQEQAEASFKKLQENFTAIQTAAFNPFELQKIIMNQHLETVKQFNRQFEGQLEKFYGQFAAASEKLNTKK